MSRRDSLSEKVQDVPPLPGPIPAHATLACVSAKVGAVSEEGDAPCSPVGSEGRICCARCSGARRGWRRRPRARNAYVANAGSGTVSVIDAGTNAAVGTIPVGVGPVRRGDHPQWALAPTSPTKTSGTVSVIDTASNAVVGDDPARGRLETATASPSLPMGRPPGSPTPATTPSRSISTATNAVSGAPIPLPPGANPTASRSPPMARRPSSPSRAATSRSSTPLPAPWSARCATPWRPRGSRSGRAAGAPSSPTAARQLGHRLQSRQRSGASARRSRSALQPSGIAIGPSGVFAYAAGARRRHADADRHLHRTRPPPPSRASTLPPASRSRRMARRATSSTPAAAASRCSTRPPMLLSGSIPVGSAPDRHRDRPRPGRRLRSFLGVARSQRIVKQQAHLPRRAPPRTPTARSPPMPGTSATASTSRAPQATRTHTYKQAGHLHGHPHGHRQRRLLDRTRLHRADGVLQRLRRGRPPPAAIVVIDATGPVLHLAGSMRQRLRGRLNVFAQLPA